jgi:hypothetical protein
MKALAQRRSGDVDDRRAWLLKFLIVAGARDCV